MRPAAPDGCRLRGPPWPPWTVGSRFLVSLDREGVSRVKRAHAGVWGLHPVWGPSQKQCVRVPQRLQGLTVHLSQAFCNALNQDLVKLQMAKEAVEQGTRELRKEGELLKQETLSNIGEEVTCSVGGRGLALSLGRWQWVVGLTALRSLQSGHSRGFTGHHHIRLVPRSEAVLGGGGRTEFHQEPGQGCQQSQTVLCLNHGLRWPPVLWSFCAAFPSFFPGGCCSCRAEGEQSET